ncbi:S-acyl fatty acid synthase thioesterase, medium chain [Erethizon dorsatum]
MQSFQETTSAPGREERCGADGQHRTLAVWLRLRNEKVLNCLYPRPSAIFRLICFPWAGSGSLYFAKWGQEIYESLEVYSVRLAGRESRLEEPFANDICEMVDEIVYALLPVIQDKPFAFFGHSLGSYVAFMTALHLKEKYKMEPTHLFASSATPPYRAGTILVPSVRHSASIQLRRQARARAAVVTWGRGHTPVLTMAAVFDAPPKAVLSCDFTCFVGSEDLAKDMEEVKSDDPKNLSTSPSKAQGEDSTGSR